MKEDYNSPVFISKKDRLLYTENVLIFIYLFISVAYKLHNLLRIKGVPFLTLQFLFETHIYFLKKGGPFSLMRTDLIIL